MEKIVLAERGICELEAFQCGEKGRAEPLFHTWPTQQFGKRKAHRSYSKFSRFLLMLIENLKCRSVIYSEAVIICLPANVDNHNMSNHMICKDWLLKCFSGF